MESQSSIKAFVLQAHNKFNTNINFPFIESSERRRNLNYYFVDRALSPTTFSFPHHPRATFSIFQRRGFAFSSENWHRKNPGIVPPLGTFGRDLPPPSECRTLAKQHYTVLRWNACVRWLDVTVFVCQSADRRRVFRESWNLRAAGEFAQSCLDW